MPTSSSRSNQVCWEANSSSRSDAGSAQCRSSSMTTTGRSWATATRALVTASNTRNASAGSGALRLGLGLQVGWAGRRLAEQDPEAGAAGGLGGRPLLGGGGPQEAADHLHPRPVAGRVVGLPAGAAEHQRAPPPGLVGGLAGQGGLA